MENRNLKKELLSKANELKEVESVFCILSDGVHNSLLFGSNNPINAATIIVDAFRQNEKVTTFIEKCIIMAKNLGLH